jgi:hypothetical protein
MARRETKPHFHHCRDTGRLIMLKTGRTNLPRIPQARRKARKGGLRLESCSFVFWRAVVRLASRCSPGEPLFAFVRRPCGLVVNILFPGFLLPGVLV